MILIIGNVSSDSRWSSFFDTVKVATNIHDNKAWLDANKYPFPKISSGAQVEPSAYLRIAWGK